MSPSYQSSEGSNQNLFGHDGGVKESYLNPSTLSKNKKKGDKRKGSSGTAVSADKKSKKSSTASVKSAGSCHSRGSFSSAKIEEGDSEFAQLTSELKG